ncbi:MAG: CpaF family protein [Anaerolineae bacterium]|nr:CpaF family protein [Anaerolineae bacterium]
MTDNNTPLAADLAKLKTYLTSMVTRELELRPPVYNERHEVTLQYIQQAYQSTKLQLATSLRDQLFREILDDILGYGPLQPLLDDPEISEIMVNNAHNIFIEKHGKILKSALEFDDDDHVLQIIDRIILPLGRHIDSDTPTVDARLPDGSRVNAVIPPVAIDGPSITIRKFQRGKLSIQNLIEYNSLTPPLAEFLRACVVSRLNILISGGTGSGKTTLLNALSSYIPDEERIITIEDAAELRLQQAHVLRMETKPPNVEGKFQVTVRDLVRNTLRMRPDRIIVGEVRGGEALDMLQAMNTGHDGSLTTLHANTPRDAIARLETMVLMAGVELPVKSIRQQIASAIDLIIQIARLKDGVRKITAVNEVSGMEGDTVVMTEIYKFDQTGMDANGRISGEIKPTGMRPLFMSRLEASGFKLSPEVFGARLGGSMGGSNSSRSF